jgi:hypothetical protein
VNILDIEPPQALLDDEHSLSARRAAQTDELPWGGCIPSPVGWIKLARQALEGGDLGRAGRLIVGADVPF